MRMFWSRGVNYQQTIVDIRAPYEVIPNGVCCGISPKTSAPLLNATVAELFDWDNPSVPILPALVEVVAENE